MRDLSRVLLAFLCVVASINVYAQKNDYDDLSTIQDESKRFMDSLVASGVDTVIRYYKGSAGCPSIRPQSIVYWCHNRVPSAVIYSQAVQRKKQREIVFMRVHYYTELFWPYSLSFYDRNFDKIQNDTVGKRGKYIFNYTFEVMDLVLGERSFKFDFDHLEEVMENNARVLMIANFRSFFLDCFLK